MRLKTWYKIHKWLSVGMAAALLLWTFTGLVMVMPSTRFASAGSEPELAFERMRIAPAEAAELARRSWGDSLQVREMHLRPVLDRLAYWIWPTTGRHFLMDAETGEIFTITEPMALAIARTVVGNDATLESTENITDYSLSYTAGPLPIYRFGFDGGRLVHVSQRDGTVATRSRAFDRFKNVNHLLHSFLQLRLAPGGEATQNTMIWLFGVGSLITILTGLYLALPKRLKVRARQDGANARG